MSSPTKRSKAKPEKFMNSKTLLVILLSVIWIVCGFVGVALKSTSPLETASWITFLIGLGYAMR